MRNISLSKVRGPIWTQANMTVRENPPLSISLTTMYIYTNDKLTGWLNRMQIMGSRLFSKRLRMNMNKVPLQFMVFFAQYDEFWG